MVALISGPPVHGQGGQRDSERFIQLVQRRVNRRPYVALGRGVERAAILDLEDSRVALFQDSYRAARALFGLARRKVARPYGHHDRVVSIAPFEELLGRRQVYDEQRAQALLGQHPRQVTRPRVVVRDRPEYKSAHGALLKSLTDGFEAGVEAR